MKEEISQQRCTVGAHGYTNNLPENQASKTNVDVIDKKVKRQSSRREKYVYLVDVSSFAQKVRKLLVDEAFPLVLNTLSKRSWSCFLSWACGRSNMVATFWITTMGRLSNNVGDGNENGKKPIDLH